jgi:hypothetical protein
VDQAVDGLRALCSPEITGNVENFERTWKKYDQTRDEIMAMILEEMRRGSWGWS